MINFVVYNTLNMPKSKTIRGDKVDRGGPLAEQIIDEGSVKVSGRKKVRKRRDDDDEVNPCIHVQEY